MGDKYTQLELLIFNAHAAVPVESEHAPRALAMVRTKLDEARLWMREARRLEGYE